MLNHRLWILGVLFASTAAFGQDDDDEQPPGLRARLQVGTSVVERVDPDIAFVWGTAAPDERLPVGKFKADWNGTLLLRSEDRYRFHAFLQGRVRLEVNGQTVLEGTAAEPQWISGPKTSLSFGDQSFELEFESVADAAQLKLYWSSGEFPVEPVPYHSLFQAKPSPELSLIERGRLQFDAFRCGNCHAGRNSPFPAARDAGVAAPSLKHVGAGTRRDWLVEKLMLGAASSKELPDSGGKMPHFSFSRENAEAIVATLLANSAPVELIAATKLKDAEQAKDLQAGNTLVRSVGCLACHTWNSLGEATPYGGGSLDDMTRKRSVDWLTTWLANPAKLNPRHRMPVVKLTEKERAQIVLALDAPTLDLRSLDPGQKPADQSVLTRGAGLIESARCALCHELPGMKSAPPLSSLMGKATHWNRGCLQSPDRTKHHPGFPQVDAKALQAYVESWRHDEILPPIQKSDATDSLAGLKLLERKNCLGCHDRNQARGLAKHASAIAKADDSLAGLHMTLIPPRLNAVGDRMHDDGLSEAIRGEQKVIRLNWLRVRMPTYLHSPTEQSALLRHLIGHDRIPDGGPNVGAFQELIAQSPDPQQLLAGRDLLGGKGFSCVACHAVKDYTPKVTALGTRGSNLHLIGQRMRTDYFFRWTRSPLRVMPGVEMPNYQRPHEFILPGQLDQQLTAAWQALNDPNLTAPTNPAVVEQLLAVGAEDRPQVVRDLFTVPGTADENVARSFAMGLPGGHSVLFDLETCSLRAWTLGDFARQRCEGKRWYWDLAGTVLATRFESLPDIILVRSDTNEIISSETGWSVVCQLTAEHRTRDSVTLEYDIEFSKAGIIHSVKGVTDRFSSAGTGGNRWWRRQIVVPAEGAIWPWFRNSVPAVLVEHARITPDAPKETLPGLPPSAVRFQPQPNGGHPVMRVAYETSLNWQNPVHNSAPPLVSRADTITSVPGFLGRRLPLVRSIMPTALAWDPRQRLLFTSFKGHVYRIDRSVADDGMLSMSLVEEGLAAPFGLIDVPRRPGPPDAEENSALLVAHKPELLRLSLDSQGQVRDRTVFAAGWGVTDDYHDWTCGIVGDSKGNLFIGLGSDYTFKNRPATKSRWRGDILKIDAAGKIESIARGLRYPTGLAIDDQDRLFCSDQQGVQNTFNELNHIRIGHRYGVPSRHEPDPNAATDSPAVQIPHPWTRSVNGIAFIPKNGSKGLSLLEGHLLGCEFNNNLLIRMSIQTVGDVVQGAVYPFSRPGKEGDLSNFVGPLCIGISPHGEICVGGLQDGGWAGGLNMGDIVSLTPAGEMPNGIREIRATASGFDIEFFYPVDATRAVQTSQYKFSGYTRVWKGDYATPDSGHHSCEAQAATLDKLGRTVSLTVAGRKPGHVYDVSVGDIGSDSQGVLWPAIGHYTLKKIPD